MSVLYFLVLIGVLVLIHELGHFVAAKLLDFKVTRFSIGFGRPLVRVRLGETDYQLALFPLGGYVRMLGEDPGDEVPAADAARAFDHKPIWQRLIVVFAGPAANLLLPVVIYFVAFAGHRELPAAVIGDVIPGSPADRAGLEPGDRVVAIASDGARYWEDLEAAVRRSAGRELELAIQRDGRELHKYITPVDGTTLARDGEVEHHGMIGVVDAPFLPQIGVLDPGSPAARAGLRTGDLIAAVDGAEIASWGELGRATAGAARRMNVTYLRGQPLPGLGLALLSPGHTSLVSENVIDPDGTRHAVHGLEPADRFLTQVDADSPAARAGLAPGDLITAVDGEAVSHWLVFERYLVGHAAEPIRVGFRRAGPDGKVHDLSATVRQEWRPHTDEFGHTGRVLAFGARPSFVRGHAAMVPIAGRFSYAASKAVERTIETVGVMATGLWSILRGKSPSDELGGPITMFRVAAVSGARGFEAFLLMLALISVSVGLINLLPVPILDGGHMLLFAIEAIRRRPLSPRSRDRILLAGLAVVGLITVLALKNDVTRYLL